MEKEKKPRKPRAPKPPKTVGELVEHALKTALTKPTPKWRGASGTVLFNTKEPKHEDAIAECTKADAPLLKQVDESGVLTANGLEWLATQSKPKDFTKAVITAAANRDEVGRQELTSLLDGRTSGPAAEQILEALGALEQEAARIEAEREDRVRRAKIERYRQTAEFKREEAARLERQAADARAEADGLDETAAKLESAPPPKPPVSGEGTQDIKTQPPSTQEEKDFRREVAERLVTAWLYNTRNNKQEAATALERLLRAIEGVKPIGVIGENVRFDGRIHECEQPVSDNQQVRITRLGWELEGDHGEPLQRASVE